MLENAKAASDPATVRREARALLHKLAQEERVAAGAAAVPLAELAARVLDRGAALAAALLAEVSIAKNRWWEQTRQPAGSPEGGEFADMGRGRSAGGGGVTVSNTPMADRIVPASFVVPAAAANGAARSGPESRPSASPERRKGPWSDKSDPEFREFFAEKEKSAKKPNDGYGEYRAATPTSPAALGRYQITTDSLEQIGWLRKTPDGQFYWADKARAQGVNSKDEFLRNPAAQEAAMTDFLRDVEKQLVANGAKKFIGKTVVGIAATFNITGAGLVAAAHRRGAKAVLNYFREQERRNFRSNGRMLAWEKEIETRLREAEFLRYKPTE